MATPYSRWSYIAELVDYFVNNLGLDEDEAATLHRGYYTKYGLALRGLMRHHGVGNK